MKKVSVIIPFFNSLDELRTCLTALRKQTYPSEAVEIAAVDNGSTSDLTAIKAEFPDVKWLQEKRPGSYSARNFGLLHAKHEITAFTDADCMPVESWLQEAVSTLESTGAAIVGGRIDYLNPAGRDLNVYELFEEEFFLLSKHRYLIEQKGVVATANVVTYRSVFDRVGLFDPHLRNLGDGEWSLRAVARGEVLRYADTAIVQHPRRSTFRAIFKKVRRIAGGRIVLMRKQNEGMVYYLADLYRNSLFSPRVHRYALRFPNLRGWNKNIQMFALVEFMSVANSAEKIRVLLGGDACRE